MRPLLPVVALAAAALAAGCGMFGHRDEAPAPTPTGPAGGVEARLKPLASGISGKVRVIDRGDGATLLVSAINLPQGEYRVAFHERPNCSSPNGFSVGAPWAPAAAGKDPRQLVGPLYVDAEGTAEASVHVKGLRATGPDGVSGHSVVIYTGNAVTDAQPDVPNNRVACGTFTEVVPFAF